MKCLNLFFILINLVLLWIIFKKNNVNETDNIIQNEYTNNVPLFYNNVNFINVKEKKSDLTMNNFKEDINNNVSNLSDNIKYNKNTNISLNLTRLNIVDNAKISLNKTSVDNVYIKNTIPNDLSDFLLEVIKISIHNKINSSNFIVKDLERVYEQVDEYNNRRYVIIFMLYDTKHFHTDKIIIDFIININNDNLYVNTIKQIFNSYSNLVNNYDRKILNLINDGKNYYYTGGYLKDNKPIDDMIEIINSDYKDNYKLDYLNIELNFSNIDFDFKNKKYLDEYSEIYLPSQNIKKDKISLKNPNFCKKNLNNQWDKNGILKHNPKNKDCILQDTTSSYVNNQPEFYPSFILNNNNNSSYSWLIDPSRNNIIRQHGYTF